MSESFVRPDVQQFLAFLNSIPGPKMYELEPAAARAQMLAMKELADPPAGELALVQDLSIPGPAGDIPARLYDARASREPGPLMVFFHGGGWVIGDLDTHHSFCAEAARVLDLPVVSVDYRLAPEGKWPAAPDDCEAAARWVAESPAALGRKVTSLVLCGDSAGGNLAITVAMDLRDKAAAVPVIVQAPIYPATDFDKDRVSFGEHGEGKLLTAEGMNWFIEQYAPDVTHPRAAPIHGEMRGLPPAAILTASLDPIRDQGRAYAAALVEAGVPVTFREAVGNIHGFITLRKAIPSSIGDVVGYLGVLKAMIAEAEANRVMVQAAG